jgi:hypothetical protein
VPKPIFSKRIPFICGAVDPHQRSDFNIERSVPTEVVATVEVHANLSCCSRRQREKAQNNKRTHHGNRTSEALMQA